MSFFVQLTIEDKTYQVRRYYIWITRDDDAKGRPKSDPVWKLAVMLESVSDQILTNWMLDPKKLVDGKLTLYKMDGSKMKEVEFKKSTCSFMYDHFNVDEAFITSYIYIQGKDIKINTAQLQQSWAGH